MATINVIILYMYHLCLFLKPGITRGTFDDLYDGSSGGREGGACTCEEGFSVRGGKCEERETVHPSCKLLENVCVDIQGCEEDEKDECIITCECNAVQGNSDSGDSSRCEGIRFVGNKDGSSPNCEALESFCENGQICINREEKIITCECAEGFMYIEDSRKCQAETWSSTCKLPVPFCENGQICSDISQKFAYMKCDCADDRQCQENYNTLNNEHSLLPCKPPEQFCNNGKICMSGNQEGQVICECGVGSIYNAEKGTCEETVPPNCQLLKQFCKNGKICINNRQRSAYITCDCTDENQCNDIYGRVDGDQGLLKCKSLNQFCENGQICRYENQQNGDVTCECASGYAYNAENGKCEDINECVIKGPVCTTGVCMVRNDKEYECSCKIDGNNLSGLPCDPLGVCIYANPCEDHKHSSCTNTIGSFQCQCVAGYQMSIDELICEAVSTPMPSTISDETSTTSNSEVTSDTTSDDSAVFAKSQSESGEISLSAIVVPVVVLLIGVGVGLAGGFLCRKRCLRSKKSNQTQAKCGNSYINQTSEVNDNHFETLQVRGSAEVLYHCIDVESSNIYSTIDIIDTANVSDPSKSTDDFVKDKINEISLVDSHDYHILEVQDLHATINTDDVSGEINRDCDNETGYQIPCSKETESQEAHNYFSIKPEYTHLSTDLKNKPCKPGKGQIDAACNQTMHPQELGGPKTKTYFILEPRESELQENENECTDETDLKSSNKHGLPAQASSVEGDSHNYFVLEPEGSNLSCVSEVQSGMRNGSNDNCKGNSGNNNNRRAGNHDYCVLEPQADVQSLQSEALQIQTMSDNEYNMLTMKCNEINRLKFSELKSKGQDMEANMNSSEVSEKEY